MRVIPWPHKDKEGSLRALGSLVLLLATLFSLAPSTPAYAAVTLTKDGIASASKADCVIDIDSLQDFDFSTTNNSFQVKREAGTYKQKDQDADRIIYGVYYVNTPRAGESTLSGSFELVWHDALLDSSGNRHDLHAKFSNIHVKWKSNPNVGEVSQQLLTISNTYIRIISDPGCLIKWNSSTGAYEGVYDPWESGTVNPLGVSCDVTFWNGDDSSLKYNLFACDIDQPDRFTGTTIGSCSFDGAWAESFVPGSSFSVFHTQQSTWLTTNGTRISGTKTDDDENQNRSAFVSLGTMQGSSNPLSFTWKGSMCSTRILQDWSHTLRTRVIGGVGGTIYTKTDNQTLIKDNTLSTWNSTSTVPKNSYLVTATPDEGYHVDGMWLDGELVSDEEIAAAAVSVPNVNANHTVSVRFAKDAPQTGLVALTKVSAASSITDDNSCYSLEGAVYGVYADAECTVLEGTLTTNAQGTCEALEIEVGSYYLKENQASHGYACSDEVSPIEVTAGETTTVTMQEIPLVTSVDALVQKVDAATGSDSPQGAATLEDAEFTVRFYAGDYDKNSLPSSATRAWVLRTDEHGRAALSGDYKASGDEFYILNDQVVIPLGTLSLQETKAPNGYLRPQTEPLVYSVHLNQDGTAVEGIPTPTVENPTTEEQIIYGGLKVKKTSKADNTPLAGATFAIKSDNIYPVIIAGHSYARGDVCLVIESQEDGIASTDAHALPFGSYIVYEQQAPTGYATDTTWRKTVLITVDGLIVDLTDQPLRNERITTQVPLVATKTFDGASQGMTLEEGMFSFALYNQSGEPLQTKTNDANGRITFDPLTFDRSDLNKEHVYTIREVTGDDDLIVYDSHIETIRITLAEEDDGTLTPTVRIDDDGLTFHNEVAPDIDLPMTGRSGSKWAGMGAVLALVASGIAGYRIQRRRSFS